MRLRLACACLTDADRKRNMSRRSVVVAAEEPSTEAPHDSHASYILGSMVMHIALWSITGGGFQPASCLRYWYPVPMFQLSSRYLLADCLLRLGLLSLLVAPCRVQYAMHVGFAAVSITVYSADGTSATCHAPITPPSRMKAACSTAATVASEAAGRVCKDPRRARRLPASSPHVRRHRTLVILVLLPLALPALSHI